MVLARMIRVIGWKRDRHECYWAISEYEGGMMITRRQMIRV